MILTCASCGRKKRSPAARLADAGRCGNCRTEISPVRAPIEADPETGWYCPCYEMQATTEVQP